MKQKEEPSHIKNKFIKIYNAKSGKEDHSVSPPRKMSLDTCSPLLKEKIRLDRILNIRGYKTLKKSGE